MNLYQVFQNGQEQKVNTALIKPAPYNCERVQEFAICGFSGNDIIEIKTKREVRDVVIRPLSAAVKFCFDEHSVKIYLSKPSNFSVEFNGSSDDNLLIFASEEREYELDGMNIIHITEDCRKDRILIDKDNTSLVIDEGICVNSKIEVNDCENIKICGRGIITQSGVEDKRYRICLDVLGCRNVEIEDITITESLFWTLRLFGCDNVHIKNIKIIGYRGNNDGIDVCGSRNVTVDGAFIRTWDDSFVVKAVDERDKKSVHYVVEGSPTDMTKAFGRVGDVYNILFKNSVLWNDFARPIEIGVSLRADRVHDIRYENIDIIHSTTGYPLMGAHHGDRAEVYNVEFENIRIEDTPGAQLFDFRITDSEWSTDDRKGCMHDFSFKNISLIGKPGIDILPEASRLEGFSDEHGIKNFSFENVILLGKAAENSSQLNLDIRKFAEGIVFKNTSGKPCIGTVISKIELSGEPVFNADGNFTVNLMLTLENKSDAAAEGAAYIKASPKNSGNLKSETEYALLPHEKKVYEFCGSFPPGKHCFSVESDNLDVKSAKLLVNLPLYVANDINSASSLYFTNYYGDTRPPIYISVSDNRLILKSELIASSDIIIYTADPVPTEQGEVMFTVEETDFGEAPALVMGEEGPVSAPQLRCPEEITYVFHNEPKVEKISRFSVPKNESGCFTIPLEKLGVKQGEKTFLLEICVNDEKSAFHRYPCALGHSVVPDKICHMFLKTVIE